MNDTNEIHFINSKGEKCIMYITPNHTFLNSIHRRSLYVFCKMPAKSIPLLLWDYYKRNGCSFHGELI
jgi:hypothetical protein